MIARLFRTLFSTVDNQHPELGRVLWGFGALAMIVYQGAAIFARGQTFSPIEFGTGFAALLAAGGFGIAAKDKARAQAQQGDA